MYLHNQDKQVKPPLVCTGVSVECQVDRSQIRNREIAMRTLTARIYQRQVEAQASRTQAARKQQVSCIFIVNPPQDVDISASLSVLRCRA